MKTMSRAVLLAATVFVASGSTEVDLCNSPPESCLNCTAASTPFPSIPCCPIEPNVRWIHTNEDCSLRGVTQDTWKDPQCWYPNPPSKGSFVEFYTNATSITINLSSLNITEGGPADFTVRGIVVRPTVSLTVLGVVQVTEAFIVEERASVRMIPTKWNPYISPIEYLDDPKQTSLGLRSCKDLPVGFYSRICGPGTLNVAGTLSTGTDYYKSSVFAPMIVTDGGWVENVGFLWGRTTVLPGGKLSMSDAYLHASVMVFRHASVQIIGGWFDGWSLDIGEKPEHILSRAITNCGNVVLRDTFETYYIYANYAGTYNASVFNYEGGTCTVSGVNGWQVIGGTVTTIANQDGEGENAVLANYRENKHVLEINHSTDITNGFVNYGKLIIKKPLTITKGDLVNYGEIIVDGKLSIKGSLINKESGSVIDNGKIGTINNQIVNHGKMILKSGKPTNGIVNTRILSIEFKANLINNENGKLKVLEGASITHLVSRGKEAVTTVSGTTLFVNTYHCVDCTTKLINNGTFYVIPGSPAPNGILKSMNDIDRVSKGSPEVCVSNGEHKVCGGCSYPVSFDHGSCTTKEGGFGTFSYPDDTFCYPCDMAAVDGVTSEVLKKIIKSSHEVTQTKVVSPPRETVALSVEDDEDLRDIEIRSLHLRNARIVSPDASGRFIATTTTHIEGKVSAIGSKLYLVNEHNSPAILGGGDLEITKQSLISISIESYVSGGGHLIITEGSALDISSHSTIAVHNHSLTVTKTGSLHVNGKLHFHEAANVNFCGVTKGFGKMNLNPTSRYGDECF
eukprot:TRINITY_DN1889_c5_g1_i1.p1 TRINITY_DN1889_c5_g1~~TRINITY_DN1889_c5_g1_i1.p1  ORF type:complete len:807 (+),score=169.01 TRINITY_DN1889_c5_g1_i1:39-2423(+)